MEPYIDPNLFYVPSDEPDVPLDIIGDGKGLKRASKFMFGVIVAIVLFIVLVVLATNHADAAQMSCSEREDVMTQLGGKYGEVTSAVGLANNGGLIELITSEDGSTWTLVVSMPNGPTCLLAAGENWTPVDRAQGEKYLKGKPTL